MIYSADGSVFGGSVLRGNIFFPHTFNVHSASFFLIFFFIVIYNCAYTRVLYIDTVPTPCINF